MEKQTKSVEERIEQEDSAYKVILNGVISSMHGVENITGAKKECTASKIFELRKSYLKHMEKYSPNERGVLESAFNATDRLFNDLIRSGRF